MTAERPRGETLTAILLIAHGSRRAEANDDLFALAARVAATGLAPIVEPAFLELAEPDIAKAGARCVELGASRVLMMPVFLSMGVHLTRDLVQARDDLAQRHPGVTFHLGSSLGPHPLLDQLLLERIRETDEAARIKSPRPVNPH